MNADEQIKQLTEERYTLQEIITGMEGELAEAHAQVEVMRGERDGAQKACAEMRDLIDDIVRIGTYDWNADQKAFTLRTGHALSSDCGKGYHHEREILPLVTALNQIRDNHALCETDAAVVEQALAHWEKVKEAK